VPAEPGRDHAASSDPDDHLRAESPFGAADATPLASPVDTPEGMFGAASATRLGLASEWVASGSARCLRQGCAQAICARGARRDQRLDAETQAFLSNGSFSLHKMNGRQIHRLLARMIDFVETRSGMPSHYVEYAKRGGKSGSEIEHVWADHPERHEDDFAHPSEFAEYRNRIGGLLLLPKSFNASYGDLPYEQKLVHYDSQNLPTTTTRASAVSWSKAGCLSGRTLSSARLTTMTGRSFTVCWPNTSGTQHGLMRRSPRTPLWVTDASRAGWPLVPWGRGGPVWAWSGHCAGWPSGWPGRGWSTRARGASFRAGEWSPRADDERRGS
jgi:Protein of unknown function (DUF1524)